MAAEGISRFCLTQTTLDLKNSEHLIIKIKLKLLELALRHFNKTIFREDDEELEFMDEMPFVKIKEDEEGSHQVKV